MSIAKGSQQTLQFVEQRSTLQEDIDEIPGTFNDFPGTQMLCTRMKF